MDVLGFRGSLNYGEAYTMINAFEHVRLLFRTRKFHALCWRLYSSRSDDVLIPAVFYLRAEMIGEGDQMAGW